MSSNASGTMDGNATVPYSYPQNPADYPAVKAILYTFYPTVFALGVSGNLLVLYVLAYHRSMRTTTNLLLFNICFSDLLVCLFCVLQELIKKVWGSWLTGEVMCVINEYMATVTLIASVLFMVAICIERYIVIVYPLKSSVWITKKKLTIEIVALWCASMAWASYNLVVAELVEYQMGTKTIYYCRRNWSIVDGPHRIAGPVQRAIWLTEFVLAYLLPVIMMTSLYSYIILTIWRSVKASGIANSSQMKSMSKTSKSCPSPVYYPSTSRAPTADNSPQSPTGDLLDPNSAKKGGNMSRSGSTGSEISLVSNREKKIKNKNKPKRVRRQDAMATRRKVIYMLIAALVTFVVFVLPLHWSHLDFFYGPDVPHTEQLTSEAVWFIFINIFCPISRYFVSAINPFLYAIISDKFREKMLLALKCRSIPHLSQFTRTTVESVRANSRSTTNSRV